MRTDDRGDDHLLIARIVRRDATALEQLYTRYRPRLWRYLLQQLNGDSSAVDDLLQEIFLAVWRAAGDFRGEARVNTWIFRIAHHQLAHRQRATSRRPEGHLAVLALPDDDRDLSAGHARNTYRTRARWEGNACFFSASAHPSFSGCAADVSL